MVYLCVYKYAQTISSPITLKTESVSLLITESSFSLFPYCIAKSNPIHKKIESKDLNKKQNRIEGLVFRMKCRISRMEVVTVHQISFCDRMSRIQIAILLKFSHYFLRFSWSFFALPLILISLASSWPYLLKHNLSVGTLSVLLRGKKNFLGSTCSMIVVE